jgi:carbonic anhydrase
METLLAGYRRFLETTWPERRELHEQLAADGQKPLAVVVACVDSRLDPAAIFDAAPGQIFVLRNVANLVPPYAPDGSYHGTSAALEFAIKGLGVSDIIVMGHAQCGGVRALLDGKAEGLNDFVMPWMQIAARARTRALQCDGVMPGTPQAQSACEHETVRVSLENLKTFPWITERIEAGTLRLHGMYYGIASGVLEVLREDGGFQAAI